MSDCLTIDVIVTEQKYADEGLTTKDIVQSILNEALHSVIDKSDTEKKNQHEDRSKEYKVLKEQALVDNELKIQNGKIHLQANGSDKVALVQNSHGEGLNTPSEINKGKDEGIQKKTQSPSGNILVNKYQSEYPDKSKISDQGEEKCENSPRPFTPFTTEDLRQSILEVWKNVNSPVLNGWDGDLVKQPQEVVRLMEELSHIQVSGKETVDPNRPRACSLVEEDVKKMILEIENMNFNSNSQTEVLADRPDTKILSNDNKLSEQTGSAEEIQEVKLEDEERDLQSRHSISLSEKSSAALKSPKRSDHFILKVKESAYPMDSSESDEVFIESSESVIQIIEPHEDSNDETEEGKIEFSLLNESGVKNDMEDFALDEIEADQTNYDSDERSEEELQRKVLSGMTTVGPMKNTNYDPKILTWSNLDYGTMTRITGSQELKKDSREGNIHCSTSRKFERDENSDGQMIVFENGCVGVDTIINHDIASLTKVQRVKEVLSDQTKSVEEFKDEDRLIRPPLDLKDVDSVSCDSYNVLDLNFPMVPGEISNCRANLELAENLQALRIGPADSETENQIQDEISHSSLTKTVTESKSRIKFEENPVRKDVKQVPECIDENMESLPRVNSGHKHNTISRVLQKASSKLLMKDSDSFARNSKSLPRDTNKIGSTEGFKSILDDYQSSAAAVLRKSRSLLKTTQNVLKSVNKTGFGPFSGDKQSNETASDRKVDESEDRQCSSSRKNDFSKIKDTIKKVGKTLRSFENIIPSDARGSAADGQDATDKIESESVDMENVKKVLPPKSPLVCANQSQSTEKNKLESGVVVPDETLGSDNTENDGKTDLNVPDKEIEVLCDIKFQRNCRYMGTRTYSNSVPADLNSANTDEIDFAAMDTIHDRNGQQIPTETDEERCSEITSQISTGAVAKDPVRQIPSNYLKNASDIGKSFTIPIDGTLQGEPFEEFIGTDGKELQKSLSIGKLRRKNKKLSARIRSFWQFAFGKMKATGLRKDFS